MVNIDLNHFLFHLSSCVFGETRYICRKEYVDEEVSCMVVDRVDADALGDG